MLTPRKKLQVNEQGYRVGETHQGAKLTDADVELIRWLHDEGLSYSAIAAKFDDGITISKFTVRDICTMRTRAQTGYPKGSSAVIRPKKE